MIQSSGIFQSQRSSHACIILLFNSMHNAWPDPIFSTPDGPCPRKFPERSDGRVHKMPYVNPKGERSEAGRVMSDKRPLIGGPEPIRE